MPLGLVQLDLSFELSCERDSQGPNPELSNFGSSRLPLEHGSPPKKRSATGRYLTAALLLCIVAVAGVGWWTCVDALPVRDHEHTMKPARTGMTLV